jgi:hypothetical protein
MEGTIQVTTKDFPSARSPRAVQKGRHDTWLAAQVLADRRYQ